MGRGIIKLELLSIKDLLRLPKGYEVISAAYDHESEILDIVVQSAQITTRRSNKLAQVTPVYEHQGSVFKIKDITIS